MTEPNDFEHPGSGSPTSLPGGFRAAVSSTLVGMGYAVVGWEPDGVSVIAPDRDGEHYVGLSNLFRRAKLVDKGEWPRLIREFLGQVTGATSSTKVPDDLMAISSQLRPRLGKPFANEIKKACPWAIPLSGTGLEINLVIDYPNTMAYVTEEMLAKSGRAGEDLLDIALANLKASTAPDFFERVSDEIDIYVGHSGDGYDAARALLVEDLFPESPAGFWVVLPTRDEIAVWPVSFAALYKIHIIKIFAQDNFRDHAYPVTDDVFWIWNGTWYPFSITLDEPNVDVTPPDEFMRALEELEGEGTG